MKAVRPPTPGDNSETLSALIETLSQTDQRLEQLTAGEVDSVANSAGQTFLLRHAQDRLRLNQSARQAAVLNALPASIALLDRQGVILSVNEAWHDFGRANAAYDQGRDIGVNYLTACDKARGNDAAEASQAAAGIRAVMNGEVGTFTLEYPCHSPAEQRWFRMTVTPMGGYASKNVVVMHSNITSNKLAENALRQSEEEFRTLTEAMPQIVWITRADGWNTYFNQHWMDYTGLTLDESLGDGWKKPFHPDDQQPAWDAWQRAITTNEVYSVESRLRRADGTYRWWLVRGVPILGVDDRILKWFGTCTDIHDLKMAGLEITRANGELRESERRFSDLLGTVELVSMMLDREARITYCNDFLLRLTGWEREEVIGKDWWELFVPPESQDLGGAYFTSLLDNQAEALHHENDIVTRSGERRLIRWNNSVLRSPTGEVTGTAGIGEDITERNKAAARIAQLNRVLNVLSSINTVIVRADDRDELFREACNVAVRAGGFRMAMLAAMDPVTMLAVSVTSAGKSEELMAEVKSVLSSSEGMQKTMIGQVMREGTTSISNDTQNDNRLIFGKLYAEEGVKSMTVLPLMISGKTVGALALYASEMDFFQNDEMYLLTELAGDIAFAIDHIDRQDRLNYLAYYDVLTGLANRTLFSERLNQRMANAEEQAQILAVVFLDIERFKSINDTLGRDSGDGLLRNIAQRMSDYGGDASRLARIDADHFAVLVQNSGTREEVARLIKKRIGEVFTPPFQFGESELRITAKFGISMFPADGTDADTLLKNAEVALKMAKATGEQYLFYTLEMNATVASNLAMENQMRRAIGNDEFVLHYQPKVNIASGKVTSAEALIRWNDPRNGLVPPGKFIPILEETGMIYEVGRWALQQVIADNKRWRAAGLATIRIAVNVSARQLRDMKFIDEIRQLVALDSHAAAGLELEITESVVMSNVEFNIATLDAIRALGVTIAIDDFGTGFSSLSYLAKLPVDTLKIDRTFVIEMTVGPEGLSLVSTIINLAHALKRKVVAEGVETDEQSHLLHLLGCDEMQGFLFSKPVPADIFETRFLTPLSA